MIIDFSVKNFLSFQEEQTLSLLPVDSEQNNILLPNTTNFSTNCEILKSSVILGANASGKTNFLLAIKALKDIICNSIGEIKENFLSKLVPFALQKEKEMSFDIKFIESTENKIYRYCISIKKEIIIKEHLYICKNSDEEHLLFNRKEQKIEGWDQENFDELSGFINSDNELIKTRNNVPLLSVLKTFSGKTSSTVFDFFNEKMIYLSGLNEIKE